MPASPSLLISALSCAPLGVAVPDTASGLPVALARLPDPRAPRRATSTPGRGQRSGPRRRGRLSLRHCDFAAAGLERRAADDVRLMARLLAAQYGAIAGLTNLAIATATAISAVT